MARFQPMGPPSHAAGLRWAPSHAAQVGKGPKNAKPLIAWGWTIVHEGARYQGFPDEKVQHFYAAGGKVE